jgi:hypothetical protein
VDRTPERGVSENLRTFMPSRRRSRPAGAEHRYGIRNASRTMERYAYAYEIRGKGLGEQGRNGPNSKAARSSVKFAAWMRQRRRGSPRPRSREASRARAPDSPCRARAGTARTARPTKNIGAAQDLLALNIDLSSVMQAGRWKDTRMPMRYGEKVLASRGAMARAAKSQGRA